MPDEQNKPGSEWRDVGNQFRMLGDRLATALRVTWESEETRQDMRELQAGLESMVSAVGKAIDEAAATPEAQRIRDEALRAASSARVAGSEAWSDARPHVLAALRRANDELDKVIGRMGSSASQAPDTP